MHGAKLFDRAAPGGDRAEKAQAFVYGGNHNNWNTVWIDPFWPYGGDDGVGSDRISAADQQQTAAVYITAWLMAFCQGRREMLDIHRNRLVPDSVADLDVYWSFEDPNHVHLDNFQNGTDPYVNGQGGAVVVTPPADEFLESPFTDGAYDGSFYQDTRGLIVGWSQPTTYESEIPSPLNVSLRSHFAIRAALIDDNGVLNPDAQPQRFSIDLEDADGNVGTALVSTDAFDPIPFPYFHPYSGYKSMLSSVRVPLRAFTQDNGNLDLTRISKVTISFEDTGLLAIDDIQFSD
jgi:hypothetical protein